MSVMRTNIVCSGKERQCRIIIIITEFLLSIVLYVQNDHIMLRGP